jgi:hypothetical protein
MTDKALAARPTMTLAEEAAWAAGVQSAAAEMPERAPVIPSTEACSAAALRARVPIRRVRLQDEREVAP